MCRERKNYEFSSRLYINITKADKKIRAWNSSVYFVVYLHELLIGNSPIQSFVTWET